MSFTGKKWPRQQLNFLFNCTNNPPGVLHQLSPLSFPLSVDKLVAACLRHSRPSLVLYAELLTQEARAMYTKLFLKWTMSHAVEEIYRFLFRTSILTNWTRKNLPGFFAASVPSPDPGAEEEPLPVFVSGQTCRSPEIYK